MCTRPRALLATVLAFGCVGDIDAIGEEPGDTLGVPTPGADPAPNLPKPPASAQLRFRCGDTKTSGLSNPAVRRLSSAELVNTLRSLLGDTLFKDGEVQALLGGIPPDGLKEKATDFAPLHHVDHASSLFGIARRVGAILEQSATERPKLFGACAGAAAIDTACATAFVKAFGARVYRRPLGAAEEAEHLAQFDAAGGGIKGMNAILFRLMQSPALAFHLELGAQVTGNRSRLTDHEVASRIAYLTTAGPPDQALRDLAARPGELQKLAVVKTQVERLLDGKASAARARVRAFFDYYGQLEAVPDPFQGAGDRNKIVTAGLSEELQREALDFAENVFWTRNGGFRELMTSRESLPRSEALRFILGAPAVVPSAGAPVEGDADHLGFLHRPAVLASVSPRTSPILRGAHVRIRYLCDHIADPPTDIVDEAVAKLGDIENQSNRAKVEQLTSQPICVGCHSQINSLGYPFEKFDQLGVQRDREIAQDASSKVIGTFDIDTRITNPKLDLNESPSTSIADSRELVTAIGNGSKGRSCFAQRAVEFTRTRPIDPDVDGCSLNGAETIAHSGSLRDIFVHAIANEDIFWRNAAR